MDKVTQVHGMSKEELLIAFDRLEQKIVNLQKNHFSKPKMYSVKELSEHCGVAELTVRNWINEGKITAKTIGRRIFIEEEEFQRALSEVKSLKYQRA
ncbi:helix-turn-helix domain-containing protein [Zunongwangia sp. SCSIO 43204]|uniref:helix-turn-helix domain-containing protein n=1 Tax=Zunongwangia sp. SCSIO 43204 TaxID=2779359 RepID=UPI001CA7E81A|nr:helix-turn-helix domain-containing protein [Zunongwangia sp. SCSIO 43204]UAB84355.1 helix-turn-helix domain-containing protein [Zunongwangia sp. SCSIO 43204]